MMKKRGQHKNFWLTLSFIGILVAIAMPAFAWLNIAQVSNQPGFSNYTITDPITIAATERAGIKSSADFSEDPYGPNLQPGADMSGTGGTTSGGGTVNGDVADDWRITANTDATVTAGKTSNDYQMFYGDGGALANIYCDASGVSITTDEIWLAEIYTSGVVGTPSWRVTDLATGNPQYSVITVTGGYQRKIFTAGATITATNNIYNLTAEGCTIHWARLRKLSGANAILTELDRTLRANGTELVTDGDFPNADNWTEGTGWSIGAGVASCDGSQVGVSFLSQTPIAAYEAAEYEIKFTVSNYSAGNVKPQIGSAQGTNVSANGTYVEDITWVGALTLTYIRADVDFVGDIDNFSVQKKQPTLTTTKRVNYVETVLDTSYVDVLDADVARTWAITQGTPGVAGDVITFSIGENQAVQDNGYFTIGNQYEVSCTVSGYGGSGTIYLPYSGADITGDFTAEANGDYTYIVNPSNTNATIYAVDAVEGVVTVNSIRKVGPRNLVTVKDGTSFNVFYNNTKITEETISDASVIYNKLHSSYGDSTADATIIRYGAGALIATGTCTINKIYLVAVTQADHYGTGVLVGDFFVSDGTETNDANNQVRLVN